MFKFHLISIAFWFLIFLPVPLLTIIIFLHYSKGKLRKKWRMVCSILFLGGAHLFWTLSLTSLNPWVDMVRSAIFNYGPFIACPSFVIILIFYLKSALLSQKRFGLSPAGWKFSITLSIAGCFLSAFKLLWKIFFRIKCRC